MRHSRIELDEFDQVTYGRTSKLHLPKATCLSAILLAVKNIDKDQLGDIQIKLDSDISVALPMEKILKLEEYHALTVAGDTTFYNIPYQELFANTQAGQESVRLQVLNENALLSIKIGAATSAQTSGNLKPELNAFGVFGEPMVNEKTGGLYRPTLFIREEETISINKSGNNKYEGFEAQSALGTNLLRRAHFFGSNVIGLTVYVRSGQSGEWIKRHEASLALNNRWLKEAGKNPISDCYTFDPTVLGWVNSDSLMPEMGIKFEIETSNSDNVDVVWEKIRLS